MSHSILVILVNMVWWNFRRVTSPLVVTTHTVKHCRSTDIQTQRAYWPRCLTPNISTVRTTKYSITHFRTTSKKDRPGKNDHTIKIIFFNDRNFIRFCEADPAQFRVGDIVEAQTTIAVVPLRNNKFKMICSLRSLALLNGGFTDVSHSSCALTPFWTSD